MGGAKTHETRILKARFWSFVRDIAPFCDIAGWGFVMLEIFFDIPLHKIWDRLQGQGIGNWCLIQT